MAIADRPLSPFSSEYASPSPGRGATGSLSSRPLRIVALGGGTGLSNVLQGLKQYTVAWDEPSKAGPLVELAAVVTVSDDGGSSGKLRRAFDMLAPGDIRNCMVALAEDETLLSKLFQFRFANGKGLDGHSFGNLFLTALTEVTGDFHQAIQLSSEVLAIRGHIFPSTLENVRLQAELQGGRRVQGETRISRAAGKIRKVHLRPRRCAPLPETLEALADADLITLGPGSLYTSVIPNLLVEGVADAIRQSRAPVVYISNLMWQPGETDGHSASDHLRAIHEHSSPDLVDIAVLSSSRIPAAARRRYAEQEARPVTNDRRRIESLGVQVIQEVLTTTEQTIRHDSNRLAQLLVKIAGGTRSTTVDR